MSATINAPTRASIQHPVGQYPVINPQPQTFMPGAASFAAPAAQVNMVSSSSAAEAQPTTAQPSVVSGAVENTQVASDANNTQPAAPILTAPFLQQVPVDENYAQDAWSKYRAANGIPDPAPTVGPPKQTSAAPPFVPPPPTHAPQIYPTMPSGGATGWNGQMPMSMETTVTAAPTAARSSPGTAPKARARAQGLGAPASYNA